MDKEESKKDTVDWVRFEAELRCEEEGEWMERLKGEGKRSRMELEEVVERFEGCLKEKVEGCRGRRRWKDGKKKWWNKELEESYKRGVEMEREWEREGRTGVGKR